MPSLSALRDFKASFDNIGNQKADLLAKGSPLDDFPLPDTEPLPLDDTIDGDTGKAPGGAESDNADSGVSSSPVTSTGDFDFSAFLEIGRASCRERV